jgi:hypothetical protein
MVGSSDVPRITMPVLGSLLLWHKAKEGKQDNRQPPEATGWSLLGYPVDDTHQASDSSDDVGYT